MSLHCGSESEICARNSDYCNHTYYWWKSISSHNRLCLFVCCFFHTTLITVTQCISMCLSYPSGLVTQKAEHQTRQPGVDWTMLILIIWMCHTETALHACAVQHWISFPLCGPLKSALCLCVPAYVSACLCVCLPERHRACKSSWSRWWQSWIHMCTPPRAGSQTWGHTSSRTYWLTSLHATLHLWHTCQHTHIILQNVTL